MSHSKVNRLHAELLSFIEGMVDPRKVEQDTLCHL
jgi:hypothetical protein